MTKISMINLIFIPKNRNLYYRPTISSRKMDQKSKHRREETNSKSNLCYPYNRLPLHIHYIQCIMLVKMS